MIVQSLGDCLPVFFSICDFIVGGFGAEISEDQFEMSWDENLG